MADTAQNMDTVILQYLEIPDTLHFSDLERYLRFVSPGRRERIRKFRFEKDRLTSLFGELLLRLMLEEHRGIPAGEIRFCADERGRPGLCGRDDVQISLSHSGRMAAAAFCSRPVGVDLEILRPASLSIADRFFREEEVRYIREAADREEAFYYIWTRKEAFIKKTGEGLSRDLRSFSVLDGSLPGDHCFSFRDGPAMISVCTDTLVPEAVFPDRTDTFRVLAHF